MPAVWVYADGRLSFAVSTSSNPNVWTYSQTSLSVGQWYFVAITVSQSQSTAEIRVKTVDLSVQTLACMYWTSGATLTTDSSSALYISERTSGTAYVLVRPAFVGQVRQLTFFTSVLTDIDIVTYLNLCNSMAFPPPSPGMQSQAHVLVDGPISAGAGRVVSLSSQPAGIPWLSTEYTYCFLIRIDSLPADWHSVWGWQRITAVSGEQYNAMPAVWVYSDGRLSFSVSTTTSSNWWTYSQTPVPLGAWTFIALTVSQSQSQASITVTSPNALTSSTAYIAGFSGTLVTDSSAALYVSERTSGTGYVTAPPPFVGQIRKLTYFDTVLSNAEIISGTDAGAHPTTNSSANTGTDSLADLGASSSPDHSTHFGTNTNRRSASSGTNSNTDSWTKRSTEPCCDWKAPRVIFGAGLAWLSVKRSPCRYRSNRIVSRCTVLQISQGRTREVVDQGGIVHQSCGISTNKPADGSCAPDRPTEGGRPAAARQQRWQWTGKPRDDDTGHLDASGNLEAVRHVHGRTTASEIRFGHDCARQQSTH
ncbi:unnamed protein product (mitochondrion) [Plasmodiophora brassicae]|uniref:Uncharacterized protein n=1 Tax=Plasmodiophora brassicae TaxID=37360 RepID=A0A3P3XZU3_PLABS|nr:unnamed protein product [Plasmodiophora brassicae]